MADRKYLENLSKKLTEEGKLIEAGWVGLRLTVIPPDASALQLEEMRNAFFAGAQHLFSSIMCIMDEDKEPTYDDLNRLSKINDELREFLDDFIKRKGLKHVHEQLKDMFDDFEKKH